MISQAFYLVMLYLVENYIVFPEYWWRIPEKNKVIPQSPYIFLVIRDVKKVEKPWLRLLARTTEGKNDHFLYMIKNCQLFQFLWSTSLHKYMRFTASIATLSSKKCSIQLLFQTLGMIETNLFMHVS